MGKFFYALYAVFVISIMSSFSYSRSATGFGMPNANSYYHGGSSSGAGSSGIGGGGHK